MTKSALTEAESEDLRKAYDRDVWANEYNSLPAAVERILNRRLHAIQGPLQSAKDLTSASMGRGKARDDCTPAEMRARGIWHGLHYVERRLTGWEDLPEDLPADAVAWEKTTEDFERLAEAALNDGPMA